MIKKQIKLDGYVYQQGDSVEVYVKLPNGKFLRLEGSAKDAKRDFGRATRPAPLSLLGQ